MNDSSCLPYAALSDPPADIAATTVLQRLIDGLGFRYHWATEGIEDQDLSFQPSQTSMSVGELFEHVLQLVARIRSSLGAAHGAAADPTDAAAIRSETLAGLAAIRDRLQAMGDADLADCTINDRPFWYLINGPIADALTHVGQIAGWRRIMGKPVAKANVVLGQPPA